MSTIYEVMSLYKKSMISKKFLIFKMNNIEYLKQRYHQIAYHHSQCIRTDYDYSH